MYIVILGVSPYDRCSVTSTPSRVQLFEHISPNNVEQIRTKDITEREAQTK
ncbi:unnamed protein product, partial [Rotaria magnacalcarata]